jgi:hypothetical protein
VAELTVSRAQRVHARLRAAERPYHVELLELAELAVDLVAVSRDLTSKLVSVYDALSIERSTRRAVEQTLLAQIRNLEVELAELRRMVRG